MSSIIDTPQGLPQCHECLLPKVYIRDCYPGYYNYLIELMNAGKRYIAVTGTAGIGKSVFYLYFFEKFKAENRNRKIIMASYSIDRKLEECKVWEKGLISTHESVPPNQSGAIYLFDGIPNKLPKNSVAICFSSPDIDWLIKMNKHGALYREIYMPNWTSKEIRIAKNDLQLDLSNETLDYRWHYFGGAVRYTFEADAVTVEQQILNVNIAITKMQSIGDVLRCFAGTADPKTVVRRLMHYDVKQMRGVFDRRLKPASKYIAYEIQESLNERLDADRKKLMTWLDGHGKPAAFLVWLFEGYAHKKLLEGVNLRMKGLNVQATATLLKLDETVGNYIKLRMADMERIFEDAYPNPDSSTLRSVDAYYLTNSGILYLFQMTRNVDHKINAEGILELLEKLGKLDDMDSVNLVFVVPSDIGERFPEQSFKLLDVFRQDLTDAEVNNLTCDKMPGIKDGMKRKLNEAGLETIGKILKAKAETPSKVSFIGSYLSDFEANRRRHKHQQSLLQLKQYCVCLYYKAPTVPVKTNPLINHGYRTYSEKETTHGV